jgi:hypothetical protein
MGSRHRETWSIATGYNAFHYLNSFSYKDVIALTRSFEKANENFATAFPCETGIILIY